MDVSFETMTADYEKDVMDIFNYYAENSFAAYPERKLPYGFYAKFLEMTKGYPAYIIKDSNSKVIGFCFLRAYNPFSAFGKTAEITYFIEEGFSGKGIGKKALNKLEEDAQKLEIKTIVASITSKNIQSVNFHKKNGFDECGRLKKIGNKFGESFDIVLMQKELH